MIIDISHQKGGVGKSTIAFNLALSLASYYKVEVIDLDVQNTITHTNKIRKENKLKKLKILYMSTEKEFRKYIKDDNDKKIGQSYIITSTKSQFDSGKSTLNNHAIKMFEDIAKQYKKSGMKIMIVGHTDADGSDIYNQKLSEKRANIVKDMLVERNVPIAKITTSGEGEMNPVADNATREGRAENRRVTAELIKN